jgi:hypothetical protein
LNGKNPRAQKSGQPHQRPVALLVGVDQVTIFFPKMSRHHRGTLLEIVKRRAR